MSNIIICKNRTDMVSRAAHKFIEIAEQALSQKDIFTVALSGGSTPRDMYSILPDEILRARIDYNKIHLFWGDERAVPPDHHESNFRMTEETLLAELDIPLCNIHRIQAENGKRAAQEYEKEIKVFFRLKGDEPPLFDLILLGMGEDGHTASLFPGSPALAEKRRLVSAVFVERMQTIRFTMTPVVINSAANIIFLISGETKAEALYQVIKGDFNPDKFPAQAIAASSKEKIIWFIDKDAASML